MNYSPALKTLISLLVITAFGAALFYATQSNGAPQQQGQSPTDGQALKRENDVIEIDVVYPAFDERLPGVPQANETIKSNLDILISQFEQQAADNANAATDLPKDIRSSVTGSYAVEYEDARVVSIFFGAEWYMRGAAHPYHTIHTYIFDKKLGKVVTVQDLFKPYSKYFEYLSSYAYEDLIKQSKEGDIGFVYDDQMLRSGTEATLENFRHVLPTKDGLAFYFEEYQVAPYAAGSQQIVIPYAYLKDYAEPSSALGDLIH
jgi:hypothetical protein